MELSLKDRIIIKGFLVYMALDTALDPIIYDWPEELEFELFIVCLISLIITIVGRLKHLSDPEGYIRRMASEPLPMRYATAITNT